MSNINNPPKSGGGGGPSSQSTPARSLGATYHNTTSKPIYCAVIISLGVGTTAECNALTDSNAAPSTYVAAIKPDVVATTPAQVTLFFIVLPGNYYTVTQVISSLLYWTEWT
jgi:hypothetical protein